jgi:YggT family protein
MFAEVNLFLQVICNLILVYTVVVLAAILMSWFPIQPGTPVYSIWRALRSVTDPVLLPLRRLIPPIGGVFDLSPIILLFGLQILRGVICG